MHEVPQRNSILLISESLQKSQNPVLRIHKFAYEHRRALLISTTTLLLSSTTLLFGQLAKGPAKTIPATISATFMLELTKFLICLCIYVSRKGPESFPLRITFSDSRLFMIPAVVYLINDNLLYLIFSSIDQPTTFEVLGNMRMISIGLLFRFFLKRSLSNTQWAALILLFIGTANTQLVTCESHLIASLNLSGFFLIFTYACLSGFAGVFTEYLYKTTNSDFLVQSMQLYAYGTIFNFLFLITFYTNIVNEAGLWQTMRNEPMAVLAVILHAFSGLANSAILKFEDNIAKVQVHSISMIFTMFITSIVYQQFPTIQLIFGICIVSVSLYLYYHHNEPVHFKNFQIN